MADLAARPDLEFVERRWDILWIDRRRSKLRCNWCAALSAPFDDWPGGDHIRAVLREEHRCGPPGSGWDEGIQHVSPYSVMYWRRYRNLSVEQLSASARLPVHEVLALEAGMADAAGDATVEALAGALDIPGDYLRPTDQVTKRNWAAFHAETAAWSRQRKAKDAHG